MSNFLDLMNQSLTQELVDQLMKVGEEGCLVFFLNGGMCAPDTKVTHVRVAKNADDELVMTSSGMSFFIATAASLHQDERDYHRREQLRAQMQGTVSQ